MDESDSPDDGSKKNEGQSPDNVTYKNEGQSPNNVTNKNEGQSPDDGRNNNRINNRINSLRQICTIIRAISLPNKEHIENGRNKNEGQSPRGNKNEGEFSGQTSKYKPAEERYNSTDDEEVFFFSKCDKIQK